MIASTVWNNLVSTLENNPTLSKYVKYVFQGIRWDIGPESLPCIMLEPISNGETEKDFNIVENVYLALDLIAFSSQSLKDFKKPIVGNADYKGILDIDNDIRGCLASSYTLGDTVIDIRLDKTNFDSVDMGKGPVRGLRIPIKILYRQTDGV